MRSCMASRHFAPVDASPVRPTPNVLGHDARTLALPNKVLEAFLGFPARRQTDCHLGFLYTNVAEALLPFSPLDLMLHFRGERPNPNWAIVKGQAGVRGRQNYIRGDDQPAAKERASERFRVGKSGGGFVAVVAAAVRRE